MYFRFESLERGINEAVNEDCTSSDPRRQFKPDGSWLPKVGTQFPGAISFWTQKGLEKYLESGLQEWHRYVVKNPLSISIASQFEKVLYEDEFQIIVQGPLNLTVYSWTDFVIEKLNYPLKEKIVAYILKGDDLLVFDHDKKWSEAGTQVPAGSVDLNEDLEKALFREIKEESGLGHLKINKKIDEYLFFRNTHREFNRRHVYLLEAPRETPDKWVHIVEGEGIDKGMNFHYFWIPAPEGILKLSGSLGYSLQKWPF